MLLYGASKRIIGMKNLTVYWGDKPYVVPPFQILGGHVPPIPPESPPMDGYLIIELITELKLTCIMPPLLRDKQHHVCSENTVLLKVIHVQCGLQQ